MSIVIYGTKVVATLEGRIFIVTYGAKVFTTLEGSYVYSNIWHKSSCDPGGVELFHYKNNPGFTYDSHTFCDLQPSCVM